MNISTFILHQPLVLHQRRGVYMVDHTEYMDQHKPKVYTQVT